MAPTPGMRDGNRATRLFRWRDAIEDVVGS